MKNLFILLLPLYIVGCANNQGIDGVRISSKIGLFESIDCESMGLHADHQTDRYSCDDQIMILETSNVQIKAGISFGVEYLVETSNLSSCHEETRILEHPPMIQPDGKVTRRYSRSYMVGNCPDGLAFGRDVFSWYIEQEWEAVKGEWIFKILVNGDLVARKKITTY